MCLFVTEFSGLFFLQDQSIRVGELKEERGIDVKERINYGYTLSWHLPRVRMVLILTLMDVNSSGS